VAREDIRKMALPVLRHRIILNFEGQAEGVSTDVVIENIVKDLPEDALAAA
jgi:MoxR-like ATPase